MKNAAINALALASSAYAYTASTAGTQNGCYYNVPGVGNFNTNFNINWGVNIYQVVNDLSASTYSVASNNAKFSRRFDNTNIGAVTNSVSNIGSYITLTVPGGQTSGPISSSQMQTTYTDILYGSVRTVAMVSGVAGTTHGFTFYSNDTQEIDFAFLTNDITLAHFTNEQVNSTSPGTSYTTAAPSDAATAWHEYRVDWVPGASKFFIDGVLVYTITGNVPTTPGFWLWNNWSNGNTWAQGPPTADNVLKIRQIDAYFNRTSVADTIAANPAQCAVSTSTSASSTKASSTVASSSSVKSSSSSSTSSGSSLTPSTVSFTTMTTGYTGTVTTTTTVVSGLQATVIVQTPGGKNFVAATTSTTSGVQYTTVTTDLGTANSVQTTTIAPTGNQKTGTVKIIYPTPATTCGNAGIAFAGYNNQQAGGQATYGYPAYLPQAYKTITPLATGVTNYIAESNDASGTTTLYGYSGVSAQTLVLDHTFYIFARQTGYYSFNIPYTDDIQFVWIGAKALTGWTRNNADIIQFWSSQIATQTPQTLAYYLTVGSYLPVRVQWANGGGAGDLRFNLYAPDGSALLQSNAGTSTGSSSVDVVQFPCDSSLGADFPDFDKET
ncbi:hypothetical protein MBLNU459_g0739t1 [Dothideomycetes sp. NU459]